MMEPPILECRSRFKPIILSVKRGRFRRDDQDAESADEAFRDNREQALTRDAKTCVFCGFQAPKWQDVHHIDDDHHHNDIDNLDTACKLCHACQHIGLAGLNGGASIIYLPELPQASLNRLVRGMYVAGRLGSEATKKQAAELFRFLVSREAPAVTALGSCDPVVLANALELAPREVYDQRISRLEPLRLLVKPKSRMLTLSDKTSVLDYWAHNIYNKVPENSWLDLAEQLFDRV